MEAFNMAQKSKRDYLRAIYQRYQQATRREKSQILNEFTANSGYNRKYAIWLLNRPLTDPPKRRTPTQRAPVYSEEATRILAHIWEATGYLCSTRLREALPLWIPWARGRFPVSSELENQILSISPRQMDRIKVTHWDVQKAGFTEIDLVPHSGSSEGGEFIYTLNATDIQTCWVERQAIMGKGQRAVHQAMVEIERRLPFPLLGIDSDNGSEFINNHLYAFCQKRNVQFTRSRPYKKDDNAHIEQKNWTHVRKLLGWDRYDTQEALEAINDLYEDLRIFQNLFQPSMKLMTKIRRGSKLIRKYDKPKTPFERVKGCPEADPAKVRRLQAIADATDPFALSQRINEKLERTFGLASRPTSEPREKPPLQTFINPKNNGSGANRSPSPWREWTFGKAAQQRRFMHGQIRKASLSRA